MAGAVMLLEGTRCPAARSGLAPPDRSVRLFLAPGIGGYRVPGLLRSHTEATPGHDDCPNCPSED